MLCEALTFTGLRDELPRLMAPGHTIMAPTNEAWAKMDESVRKDPRLVRQLLFGHMCDGLNAAGSTATTAPTAARASRLLRPSAPRRATRLPTPIATAAAPARSSARPQADGTVDWTIRHMY